MTGRRTAAVIGWLLILSGITPAVSDEPPETRVALAAKTPPKDPTRVTYQIEISGQISTPGPQGPQKFPVKSSGEFQFDQKEFAIDGPQPFSIQAVRKFATAGTKTTVGQDHDTSVALPMFYRTIHVYGRQERLLPVCPQAPLPRKQIDLVQMPFDVLAAAGLLTNSEVAVGEKWNTDDWVAPLLTGIDVAVEQSTTCQLDALDADTATVSFAGRVSGAVNGSASAVEFSGTAVVDRRSGLIRSMDAQHREKRSPGPVSPGLDVTARVQWKQEFAPESKLNDTAAPPVTPDEDSLKVVLTTPSRLRLRHGREWHLFHETAAVLMMRQLRDGSLISQCNISTTVTVPPGQHTPDQEFRTDVESSVRERKGTVIDETTVRDDDQWRIRQVAAVGDADGDRIHWDYYLCSAATGRQFSIVFSYSEKDQDEFGDEAVQLLKTLEIVRQRPALPYQ